MNYTRSLKYLSSLVDREKKGSKKYKISLRKFREDLKKIGNPQKKLKGFLIGGTKGKGSTAYIVESICRNANFKTGLFTSPHLISYRERIRINGKPITKAKFVSLIEEIAETDTDLSVFETLTAMAFLLFSREKVDYSIFEVGLGGRLDATNVFEPDVSIITPISFDHTAILGTKLSEIAKEKAKILRKDRINISAPQDEEVEGILREEVGKNIEFVNNYKVISLDKKQTNFKLFDEKYSTSLIGEVQALNASLAITACRRMGINLGKEKLDETLMSLKIPGRFQIISREPHVIIDGAHNVASIRALEKTIRKIFNRRVLLVFSCLSDKDIKGMLKAIKPVVKKIYPTEIPYIRKMPLDEIKKTIMETGMEMAETTGIIEKDIEIAGKEASSSDIIIVTGSFYLIGEALKNLKIKY
ncbi:bifunctional folylpolyglutamate synthase/dihydrofolate synthase [candidate division WOR-3 bacterium]|nr:bifunctional folylpolyglutamate synthase/dihydrofolate synthase [candidate division WOR-3 bacterium]